MTATRCIADPSAAPPSLLRRLTSVLDRWFSRCQQRALLEELDDALLRDIGLKPEDVRRECEKPFWR